MILYQSFLFFVWVLVAIYYHSISSPNVWPVLSLPSGLVEDPGSDALMEAFCSLECKYYIESQEVLCSITWRRNTPNSFSSTDGPLVKAEEENEVLELVAPRDFLKHLFSITQDKQWTLRPGEQSREEDPRFHPELSMTQQEIEEFSSSSGAGGATALVYTEVWFLDTWPPKHAPLHILSLHLASCRKQLETQLFSFCTDGGWSNGICVEKDRMGLQQVWKRQIQFNRVSPVVAAAAIAATYPSPSLLLQVSP
ncbi:LOW QUALITY PROTEIN: putative crossover junction endonuclease EME2 [Pangshura tecta]